MNIVMRAFMEKFPMSSAVRDSSSLALINRICTLFEASRNEDTELACEIMRVIRAVSVSGKVTLLADGPAAQLLRAGLAHDLILWTVVNIEDDSVPDSAH